MRTARYLGIAAIDAALLAILSGAAVRLGNFGAAWISTLLAGGLLGAGVGWRGLRGTDNRTRLLLLASAVCPLAAIAAARPDSVGNLVFWTWFLAVLLGAASVSELREAAHDKRPLRL